MHIFHVYMSYLRIWNNLHIILQEKQDHLKRIYLLMKKEELINISYLLY